MNSRVQVFKKNFSVNRTVKIITKTGHEYAGKVVESEDDYFLLRDAENTESFIFFEDILSGQIVHNGEPTPAVTPSVVTLPAITARTVTASSPSVAKDASIEVHVSQDKHQEIDPEVLRKLIEIEVRLDNSMKDAHIWVAYPKLDVPAQELKPYRKEGYTSTWESIKDRYTFACKNDRTRLPGIVADLKTLVHTVPHVLSLKRVLAYIQYETDKIQDALQSYEELALLSQNIDDWYDVAAVASSLPGKEALACFSLQKVLKQVPLTDEIDAWYFYAGLLKVSGDYILLKDVHTAREMSSEEEELLLAMAIYGLKRTSKEAQAQEVLRLWLDGSSEKSALQEALKYFQVRASVAYQIAEKELIALKNTLTSNGHTSVTSSKSTATALNATSSSLTGHVYTYKASQGYGFVCSTKEKDYFFHYSDVSDRELMAYLGKLEERTLTRAEWIPVSFETRQGPKGLVAEHIRALESLPQGESGKDVVVYDTSNPSAYQGTQNGSSASILSSSNRTKTAPLDETSSQAIDKIFASAQQFAKEGNYSHAIKQIKRVLSVNPAYPEAQQLYDYWREQARLSMLPSGSTFYERATRAQYYKNLDEAVELYYLAIQRNDPSKETAVKDLAGLLLHLNRVTEAIDVLLQYRSQMKNQQAITNLLINAYQKAGKYSESIELMKQRIKSVSTRNARVDLLWQIANNYLRLADYTNARGWFEQVIDTKTESLMMNAQMSLAFCLIKLQEYQQAEEILIRIEKLEASADIKARITEWLDEVRRVKVTGQSAQIDDFFNELSSGMSGFTRFFLEKCEYEGVPPARLQAERLDISDIRHLEQLAGRELGSQRPKDRAEYFLSAARIAFDLRSELDYFNILYQDLCRSFTSRGDALVLANGHPEAIREWYCEALKMYDGDRKKHVAELDAACALVRYLYSMLGTELIPMDKKIPYLDETLQEVLEFHSEPEKVFDAITYLTSHSRFAAKRILGALYDKPVVQNLALQYLASKGCVVPEQLTKDVFERLWEAPQRDSSKEVRNAYVELRFISQVEITSASTASVEFRINALQGLGHNLPFTLDKQRIEQLQTVLEETLKLCRQEDFGEQERFGNRVEALCQELLQKIQVEPTHLSIEGIYPVVEAVQIKAKEYMEQIRKGSSPQLTVRLAKIGSFYVPDEQQNINVQIVVENKMGCSPAESLQLVVNAEEKLFNALEPERPLRESLRGGDRRTLKIPLHVSNQALDAQTFSLPIRVKYKTGFGEETSTSESFSIRLYSADQFVEIDNPYSAGGPVINDDMFKGRDELIANLANTISRPDFMAISIYGQKRAGKSSILHHLKKKMDKMHDLLIVEVGSIGSLLDEQSKVPLFSRLFWAILRKFRQALMREEARKQQYLHLPFPTYEAFCDDPLRIFKDIFDEFTVLSSTLPEWEKTRVVLLIDEFSYLYNEILKKKLDENFMHTLKALLEARTFCAVLVGLDVMPKFMKAFSNDFNVVQDVRVTYLEREYAIKLIDEPIRRGEGPEHSRYVERAIERILDLTAGSPYYIQMFCHQLVEYMNLTRAELVTDADVNQVQENLIQNNKDALTVDRFDNLIDSGDTSPDAITKEDAKKVLQAIAMNSTTTPCSRSSIVAYLEGQAKASVDTILKDSVDTILKDLEDRQVIKCKDGEYYSILVVLFKEWLIAHK